jgi:type II secretion system protein I
MSRRGLTIMEVLLALAIFVGALAVLSKLVEIGVRASQYAQLQTRAALLAESKLGEVVAGIVPLGSGGESFPDDPAWQWQLSVSDGPVAGLVWVSVTVAPSATGELARTREAVVFTLSRWLLDPAYSAELDLAAAEAAEQ